ncbi:MAG: hypothetical protein KBT52_02030 [Paraperlucidibaca sp.]|nr:hypothetical protein [Paraperlucidibaca sp.]MBQ0722321.1 hypothetical protein [Paraperlucidibaca sp.]
MASLPELSEWTAGIYQLEVSDPLEGGVSGIDNLPLKQLANRTKFLKDAVDNLAPFDASAQDSLWAALKFSLEQAGLANHGVKVLRQQAQQEGALTITNRGVVSGCTISKSVTATRNLHIAAGICFAKGRRFAVSAGNNVASVPSNLTGSAQTVYAYLAATAGIYQLAVTAVGEALPANAIKIYKVIIPAGSTDGTDPNLTSVTLTDTRRMEPMFPMALDNAPIFSAVLNLLNANDFRLSFDLVSAVGAPCSLDAVLVTSRATNGFTVQLASAADDVVIRWRASKLNN